MELTEEEKLLTDCLYLSGMERATVLYIMASLPTLKAVRKVLWLTANENIELDRAKLYETAIRIAKEEEKSLEEDRGDYDDLSGNLL